MRYIILGAVAFYAALSIGRWLPIIMRWFS